MKYWFWGNDRIGMECRLDPRLIGLGASIGWLENEKSIAFRFLMFDVVFLYYPSIETYHW